MVQPGAYRDSLTVPIRDIAKVANWKKIHASFTNLGYLDLAMAS